MMGSAAVICPPAVPNCQVRYPIFIVLAERGISAGWSAVRWRAAVTIASAAQIRTHGGHLGSAPSPTLCQIVDTCEKDMSVVTTTCVAGRIGDHGGYVGFRT